MWNQLKQFNMWRLNRNKHLAILSVTGLVGYWIYKNTGIETKLNTLLNYDKKDIKLTIDKKVGFINDKYILSIYNHENIYESVVKYISYKYPEKINDFSYEVSKINTFNEWRYRGRDKPLIIKGIKPVECNINIIYEDHKINIDVSIHQNHKKDHMTLIQATNSCIAEEMILSKIEITGLNRGVIISFVDEAIDYYKKEMEAYKKCSNDTIRIYYYKKDFWDLLSKAPKRSLDTVYLKEGERKEIFGKAEKFFSPETRDIYLSFGIPYKSVSLIYGPPGTGKTSIIRGIASSLDCDLYVLPVSKDMVDSDFVGAFSYIGDNEKKDRIIVIEDIDTLFEERKEGDKQSGITLQSFLNCMDGFTCVEGTMLFLTANKPEVLDNAMIRSCRIDNKIKLGYADKYQTKNMFNKFLPDQKEKFTAFYDFIKHKEYTTACLQEFFFL